ncbi:uncharacterized protein PAC_00308 [Phialocephala subalpina]|uniref:GRF-type domain-containing protein n=1 Tax=Phialocephala subalpina TaxID=576137 RepID=A0A1L7WCD8_9HELO|nr:uncharacterized protein PAC_00308 [Phialocephala subalpina]
MANNGHAQLLATIENDSGDENGIENVPKENIPTVADTWPPLKGFQGRVQDGKFYCDCNNRAVCKRSKQENENKNRPFWCCDKGRYDPDNCGFYIWDHEATVAKAWLEQYGPPPRPETPEPRGKGKEKEIDLGNPWTKSVPKSKRKLLALSRENSDENENGGPGPSSQRKDSGTSSGAEGEWVEIGDPNSPSRKAAKRKRSDTPGKVLENRLMNAANAEDTPRQVSEEQLKGAAQAFPTPDTGKDKGKQPEVEAGRSGSRTSKEATLASSKLNDFIDLTEDEEPSSALTKAVLTLLRSELELQGVKLSDSTALQVGYLIDEEVATHDAKVRNYKSMISKMGKKIYELENKNDDLGGMLLALTGESQDGADF